MRQRTLNSVVPRCLGMLFLIALLMFVAGSTALDAGPSKAKEREEHSSRIRSILRQLIQQRLPELAGYNIRIKQFESRDSYLRTGVTPLQAMRSKKKRYYDLFFNSRLFDSPPPEGALKAILVHELVHIRDYTGMNAGALLKLARRYLTDSSFTRRYERQTDEGALERGEGEGLKAYRQWLYPRLDPDDLEKKRATYYTPEEIDAWMAEHQP